MKHMDLATLIKSRRKKKGWRAEDLAKSCGLSYSYITKLETGQKHALSVRSLTALQDALGVSAVDILKACDASADAAK